MKISALWLAPALTLLVGCTAPEGSPYAQKTDIPTENVTLAPTPQEPATPEPHPQVAFQPGEVNMKVKLEPLPGVKAPKLTKVVKARFQTTQGDLLIEIYPEAAPNAAKRFIELIKLGFYDKTPIFRVEPNFVAQFGINSKKGMAEWKDKNFKDDPSFFHLGPGTLAFAKAGPDTNSTQVFINYQDNSPLVQNGNFTAFGKVVKGFPQTAKFRQVPEAGDQQALWTDTEGFIKSLTEKPDTIIKAVILP